MTHRLITGYHRFLTLGTGRNVCKEDHLSQTIGPSKQMQNKSPEGVPFSSMFASHLHYLKVQTKSSVVCSLEFIRLQHCKDLGKTALQSIVFFKIFVVCPPLHYYIVGNRCSLVPPVSRARLGRND